MGLLSTLKQLPPADQEEILAEQERQRRARDEADLQARRESEARRRAAWEQAELRQQEARDARAREASDEEMARRQKQQDTARRAEQEWLQRRRELEAALENARAALGLCSAAPDFSSVESTVESAKRASSVVGAERLIADLETQLHQHDAGRPRI